MKDTGLLRSRGGEMEKVSNLLVAHRMLGAPLVTEKKWFQKNNFELFLKI